MLKSSLLKALENPILTYFPYELDDNNFDKLSEETGWRYNRWIFKILTKYKLLFHDRNASPDLPPEATPEEREAMKGYSIQTEAHKTANKAGRIV